MPAARRGRAYPGHESCNPPPFTLSKCRMLSEPEKDSAAFSAVSTALDIAIGLIATLVVATLWIACFTVREAFSGPPRKPRGLTEPKPASAG